MAGKISNINTPEIESNDGTTSVSNASTWNGWGRPSAASFSTDSTKTFASAPRIARTASRGFHLPTYNSKGKPLAIRLESFLLKRVCVVDPVLLSALTDLLSAIAASLADGIYNALVAEAFPPLVEILGPRASEDGGEVWLVSSALELIVSILEGGEKGKLGDGLVAGLAPALLDCLGRTQDRDVIVVCANPPFPYRSVISNLPWLLLTDCLILFTLTRKGLNASLSLYGKPVTSYWPGTTMQVRTGFKSLLPSSLVSCPRKRTKRLAY